MANNVFDMLFYKNVSTSLTPQFWSLPYEVAFYAICPFIISRSFNINLTFYLSILFMLIALYNNGLLLNGYRYFVYNFFSYELFLFSCGVICYDNIHKVPCIGKSRLIFFGIAILLLSWAIVMKLGGSNIFSGIIMAGFTVLAIRNIPDNIGELHWFNWGFFSYTIYIFHYAVIAVLISALQRYGIDPRQIRNPFAWLLAVPVILSACFAMYFLAEKWSSLLVAKLRRP